MNYLLQIIAFKKRRMMKPISAHAILLYYVLLEYSNEIGFPGSFTAANMALQARSNLPLLAIHRARSRLLEGGYITYRKGSENQCGTYSFTDLTIQYDTPDGNPDGIPNGTRDGTQSDKQMIHY